MGPVRAGALSLTVAGVLFVIYPAVRPFSDEVTLEGAAAFASGAWIVAHVSAMIAFVLLMLGIHGLYRAVQGTISEAPAFRMLVVNWLGIGLTLPYYGAEAFALHAIGLEALDQQNTALMALANAVRTGPGLPIFFVGLLLLAIGSVMVAGVVFRLSDFPKWSGIPFALGFVLFVPQFLAPQPIRILHGMLIAVGCIGIASGLWQRDNVLAG